MKIEGAVALVTGGASGIGKAICEKLLQGGAKVSKLFQTTNEKTCNTMIISDLNHGMEECLAQLLRCDNHDWKTKGSRLSRFQLRLHCECITNYWSWSCDYKKNVLRFIYLASKVYIINWQRVTMATNIGYFARWTHADWMSSTQKFKRKIAFALHVKLSASGQKMYQLNSMSCTRALVSSV